MTKKQEYKLKNEDYLRALATEPEVKTLGNGVLYKILQSGSGRSPMPNSVVGVYYRGALMSGRVFDDNTTQGYPDAFRLSELIRGWQIALTHMREGDKWIIYLSSDMAYGNKDVDGIPGYSTLVFEIELVSVM